MQNNLVKQGHTADNAAGITLVESASAEVVKVQITSKVGIC